MDDFTTSMTRYEAAMKAGLGADFYVPDIDKKHRKMAKNPFLFLRATCWRWAEAAPSLCPELFDGTVVPAIGDAHAGNFGLWRDASARLVWGVNDYDEAARLPYGLDLVRLCASILLADDGADPARIAGPLLAGYREGLDNPRPFVLEREHLWLRDAFAATDDDRETFWAELGSADPETPSGSIRAALTAALPDPLPPVSYSRRSAGAGSLGRARFVAFGAYRGGPIAAEAKAALPSCWTIGMENGLSGHMARGQWRSPDPLLDYGGRYVIRRLAPNSRKIDMGETKAKLQDRLIRAMGFELASVHTGIEPLRSSLTGDLGRRDADWLETASVRVARWTEREYKAFTPPPTA